MLLDNTLDRCAMCVPAEDFLKKLMYIAPVMGITRVANITGLDRVGVPVVSVARPNSRGLSVSQGKGLRLVDAKISALMESIECYHAENIYNPVYNLSYEDILPSGSVADLNGLPKLPGRQVNVSQKMQWIHGKNLLNDQDFWVPYEIVSTDFVSYNHNSAFIVDSNGLASGQTMNQAVLHGLYEVVEREALNHYALNKCLFAQKKLLLSSLDIEKNLQELIRVIRNAEINIGVWDITTKIGIPTYICKLADEAKFVSTIRPSYGSAAHFNPLVAIQKSITEALQSRLTFISGLRDDQRKEEYECFFSERYLNEIHTELKSDEYLMLKKKIPCDDGDYEDQINKVKELLLNQSYTQVLAVDLTKPEFDIPVVKILVPHLPGISSFFYNSKGH